MFGPSNSCWTTGGPEWLFALMLGLGLGGILSVTAWVQWRRPPPSSTARRLARLGFALYGAIVIGYDVVRRPLGTLFGAAFIAPPLILVMCSYLIAHHWSRASVDGRNPRPGQASSVAFYSPVIVGVVLLIAAAAVLAIQFHLGHPCGTPG
jgi:hypothetical protein